LGFGKFQLWGVWRATNFFLDQSNVSWSRGITYLLTYLLTCSMVQSPSWEANWFAASQEIPRISRNPKVHYRTHKPLPPVPILGQPNPVHIPTSHLLEIHPNIIHPSTPRSDREGLCLVISNYHILRKKPFWKCIMFISVFNQLDEQNLFHNKYHHNYRCDDTKGRVMQFWPPDDEHMCSKHVEAWNKTYCETNFVHQVG